MARTVGDKPPTDYDRGRCAAMLDTFARARAVYERLAGGH
jgi:hypothetical protein